MTPDEVSELTQRLREWSCGPDLFGAAADALEALSAELGELVLLGSLREAELVDARAERDAERALADRLATLLDQLCADTEWDEEERLSEEMAALAAWREARQENTND